MTSGYQVVLHELSAQVAALAAIGDRTAGLLASANQLAQREPMLGTAPPALHLAARLRAAAGQSGLAGAIGAANADIAGCDKALRETIAGYRNVEDTITQNLRAAGGGS